MHSVPSVLFADGLLAAAILLRDLNFFVLLYYSLDDEAIDELNRFDVLILNTIHRLHLAVKSHQLSIILFFYCRLVIDGLSEVHAIILSSRDQFPQADLTTLVHPN